MLIFPPFRYLAIFAAIFAIFVTFDSSPQPYCDFARSHPARPTLSTYPYNNRLTFYSCSGRAASEQALTNANSSVTIGRLHKSDEVVSATREHAEDVLLGAHVLER